MHVSGSIEDIRHIRKAHGTGTLGFVPTMGYLHDGHLALINRARSENDFVAASIYVNPMQFGPTEDLSRYPRDLQRDLQLLKAAGVDLVFTPDDAVMYPPGFQTSVIVSEVTKPLEGERRPGHFEGVTTVVAKLFNVVQPDRAYFGQKDAQQATVIRQMVRDLNFNLEIVICPTVREPDGLAMSSRNKYLDADQRQAATVLYRALKAAEAAWQHGEREPDGLRRAMLDVLKSEPLARVEYVSVADAQTLTELPDVIRSGSTVLLSIAVFFGQTRLIDNIVLTNTNQ